MPVVDPLYNDSKTIYLTCFEVKLLQCQWTQYVIYPLILLNGCCYSSLSEYHYKSKYTISSEWLLFNYEIDHACLNQELRM